jgi:hypothetical protein
MRHRQNPVAVQRLRNQQLAASACRTVEDLVAWFGAVQAQDYPSARWAVGQRVPGATDAAVRHAVDEGRILRTHVLRPTWHFVTRDDIRWLLALTGPRTARVAEYCRLSAGVDAKAAAKFRRLIARALRDEPLTRTELREHLSRAGMPLPGVTLGYLLFEAESLALICSGPSRDREATYALLDDRAAPAAPVDRDEALATLVRRYFQSHGPATVADFVWWSGLTSRDAKHGIAHVRPSLEHERIDGIEYWSAPSTSAPRPPAQVHLLPNWDELLVAYRDRGPSILPASGRTRAFTSQEVLTNVITLTGHVVGTWTRTSSPKGLTLRARIRHTLTPRDHRRLATAVTRYESFLERPVRLATIE